MRTPQAKGFTLIEMLAVLVIVGIVLATTIPAITNLMKSGGLNAATREVSNTLSLARQLAITHRVYARVVFPYADSKFQPDMWYRTYAVMTNSLNTPAARAEWRYASKWEYLPVGTTFLDGTKAVGALDNDNSMNGGLLPFPTGASFPLKILAYIEFSPTGAATPVPTTGGASILTVTEGFVSDTGTPTFTSKNTVGALLNVGTITVDSLVGRIQVTRLQ